MLYLFLIESTLFVPLLRGLEKRLAVVTELFSSQFLLHPRWETRAASALAIELTLTQVYNDINVHQIRFYFILNSCNVVAYTPNNLQSRLILFRVWQDASLRRDVSIASRHLGGSSCHSEMSVSTVAGRERQRSYNSSSSSSLESGHSVLLLKDFQVARTATMGEPLLAMSNADTQYAYQVRSKSSMLYLSCTTMYSNHFKLSFLP